MQVFSIFVTNNMLAMAYKILILFSSRRKIINYQANSTDTSLVSVLIKFSDSILAPFLRFKIIVCEADLYILMLDVS